MSEADRNRWATASLLTLLAGGSLLSTSSLALTIGDAYTDSWLAQPLQARIDIRDLPEGLSPSYFQLRALPASAYAQLGLDTPVIDPEQLQLRWLETPSGPPQILLSSRRAISEPVLSLLLEVRGPRQRWVRQLDLLLDPMPANTPSRFAAARTQTLRTAAERGVRTTTAPRRSEATAASPQRLRNGRYGPVRAGEALSLIAQTVRPSPSLSLRQVEQALIAANPQAFSGGPQTLKQGAILSIPDAASIRRLAASTPVASRRRAQDSNSAGPGKAFLPRYQHSQGAFYPLSIEFLSYEAVRPVDLQPRLEALEQAEPFRFKADWTLNLERGTAASSPVSRNIVPPPRAPRTAATPPSQNAPAAVDIAAAQRVAAAPAPARLAEASAAPVATARPALPPTLALKPRAATPAPVAAATSAPQSRSGADDALDTVTSQSATERSSWRHIGWLLLLAAGGLAIWWWKRHAENRNTPPPATQPRSRSTPPTPAANAESSAKPEPTTADTSRLKRQLSPLLKSEASAVRRQARVAQAMLERGRLTEAGKLVEELKQLQAAAAEPEATETPAVTAPPERADSAAAAAGKTSELDQRRILKTIRKLQAQTLPSDAERQLKVAEALLERDHAARAEEIVREVQRQLPPPEAQKSAG